MSLWNSPPARRNPRQPGKTPPSVEQPTPGLERTAPKLDTPKIKVPRVKIQNIRLRIKRPH